MPSSIITYLLGISLSRFCSWAYACTHGGLGAFVSHSFSWDSCGSAHYFLLVDPFGQIICAASFLLGSLPASRGLLTLYLSFLPGYPRFLTFICSPPPPDILVSSSFPPLGHLTTPLSSPPSTSAVTAVALSSWKFDDTQTEVQ